MYLILTFLFSLELPHFLHHDLTFSFLLLSLFEPLDFPCFDLFDDDLFALQSLLLLSFLDLLKLFDFFEPFNFHQLVFFLLLNLEYFPISLLFFELSLSDGCSLGVGHHFVHELHVIKLLIGVLICLTLDGCLELHFLFLWLTQRQVLFLLLLKPQHVLSLGLGES